MINNANGSLLPTNRQDLTCKCGEVYKSVRKNINLICYKCKEWVSEEQVEEQQDGLLLK